jgi:O-antigen/teichoic acid export membrane protein
MLNASGLPYLSARAVSAAGNLFAVAVFSRLAGPQEYGHYILIFAWSLIVYGFGVQWMRFAYFGVYQTERFGEYVGSLSWLLAGGVTAVALALTALGMFGVFAPSFLAAVFALVCGTTVYEAAFEVARTLLNVRMAALSMILRALLTVVFGCISLWCGGGARALAIAIAAAQVFAAIPSLASFSGFRWSPGSRAAARRILGYGWPLLLSFGVTAVAQTIDRLLLAHYLGAATLGPYGVVADVMRQSFTVVGEAISLSLVTIAKSHANDGDLHASNAALQRTFNACLATAAVGAAFFIVFGDLAFQAVLQPEFVEPTRGLVPIFAVAFAFMTMRNFYFAQVIYFTHASYLDLVVAIVFVAVSTTLSLLLVPNHGAYGAALALSASCVISCLAFMFLGRHWYRLPIDFTALKLMPALAIFFVFGASATVHFIPGGYLPVVLNALIFAVVGGFAIRRFGLLTETPADAALGQASGCARR